MSGCIFCREKYSSEREARIIRVEKEGYLEDAQKDISGEAWSKKTNNPEDIWRETCQAETLARTRAKTCGVF